MESSFYKKKNSEFFWCGPFLKSLLTFFYHIASVLSFVFCGILAPSLIEDQTRTPYLGQQSLNHLAASCVPLDSFLKETKERSQGGKKKNWNRKHKLGNGIRRRGEGRGALPGSLSQASPTCPPPGLHLKKVMHASQFHSQRECWITLCSSCLVLFQKAPSCSSLPFFPSYFVVDSEPCLIELSHWAPLPAMAAQPSVQRCLCWKLQERSWKEGVKERKEKWITWRERLYKVKEEGEKRKGKMKKKERWKKERRKKKARKRGRGIKPFHGVDCRSSSPANYSISCSPISIWIICLNLIQHKSWKTIP